MGQCRGKKNDIQVFIFFLFLKNFCSKTHFISRTCTFKHLVFLPWRSIHIFSGILLNGKPDSIVRTFLLLEKQNGNCLLLIWFYSWLHTDVGIFSISICILMDNNVNCFSSIQKCLNFIESCGKKTYERKVLTDSTIGQLLQSFLWGIVSPHHQHFNNAIS